MKILKKFSRWLNKIFNNHNNNNNLNNKQMDISLLRPGHYKAKTGAMSEDSIRMIRVLANDPNNSDMWILADGRKISSYELSNNYDFMFTSQKENETPKPRPKIGDLSGIPDRPVREKEIPHREPESKESPTNQPRTKVVEKIVEKRIELEQQIVDKCENLEKHQYTLNISIETNLDFDRLRNSIEILNLDKNIVAKHILNKIQKNPNNNIEKIVSEAIVKHLLNEFDTPNIEVEEKPVQEKEPEPEPEPEPVVDSEEIIEDDNMENIEAFLEHLENNYSRLENAQQ